MLVKNLFDGELPRLVMFDLDGTLVDSVPDLTSAINSAFNTLELCSVEEADVRLWVGNGAQKLVERALRYVVSEWSDAMYEQAFSHFMASYEDCLAEKSCLYLGVREVLSSFQELDVPMVIVTNKPIAFVGPLLSSLDIDSFFSLVLGGDSLSVKKPDPLPLNTVLSEYKVRPEQALMVGDSVSDFLAARSAGCPVVLVSYGYNHGKSVVEMGADGVVSNLFDLFR